MDFLTKIMVFKGLKTFTVTNFGHGLNHNVKSQVWGNDTIDVRHLQHRLPSTKPLACRN